MYLSKSQKLLIAKLGKDGMPRADLSVEECQIAEVLGRVGAVILRWKGLGEDRYAATAKGLAAIASFGQMVAKHQRRQNADEAEVTAALFASSWGCHSHFPGSLVLWTKSFPESNRQWVWEGKGEDRRKVPHPPFTVDGATLDVAVTIEAAWQELWDDDRPHLPMAEAPAIEEAL